MDRAFNGRKSTYRSESIDWAVEVAEEKGEILFTSMDNDGTKNGFANDFGQIINTG
jgi:cyclase